MMHVAEAGEDRGRVVLQLGSGNACPVALDAAVWLARAFQAEIESLFVESEQLIELASHPFAREISRSGRPLHPLSSAAIERHFRFASAAFHDQIEARARAAEVPWRQRVVRGETVSALAAACAESGPWNVIALAEPFNAPDAPSLKRLLDLVAGTTGLLLVGPEACRLSGPIVLALEHAEGLPVMLAAAERLSAVHEAAAAVCLIASDDLGLAELEAQTRLVLAERPQTLPLVAIVPAVVLRGSSAAVAEALRRLRPGLVIGQLGGIAVPHDGDLRPLAACLECPLLLVR